MMFPHTRLLLPSVVVCCIAVLPTAAAFSTATTTKLKSTATGRMMTAGPLRALTERQQQFWEDVESGLDDIESFYKSKMGLDIDRIRQFGRR